MVEALAAVASGSVQPTPQPADGATYARKLSADEGRLDWSRPAIELARRVRAFNPSPGAWFQVSGERIKVLAAQAVEGIGESGWILDDRLTIACGRGALRLTLVQRQGRGPLPADAFLRGFVLPPGTRLP
jgi:methionyl-tRNA formyltransferase